MSALQVRHHHVEHAVITRPHHPVVKAKKVEAFSGWSTLIYLVPQLIAGAAAGLVFRALNPADK